LFLKYLADIEKDKATAAELTGKDYIPLIETEYQWTVWAASKGADCKLYH
jgi:type I restriction enzyme M protein